MESLEGKQFHRWRVLSYAGKKARHNRMRPFWTCICDCGTIRDVIEIHLKQGRSKSCGCYKTDLLRERSAVINRKHGGTIDHRKEYRAWISMRGRCNNPKDKAYGYYGAIGIKVCDPWNESFENFLADLGPAPGPEYSLDRIDVLGNYEPDNCRWATIKTQNKNRRPVIYLANRSRKEIEKALSIILRKDDTVQDIDFIIRELGQWDEAGGTTKWDEQRRKQDQ